MKYLLLVIALTLPLLGQRPIPDYPKGPPPKMANGKPDFSGVWQTPRMSDVTKDTECCKGVPELPYTPWGKQAWETYDDEKEDYAGSCLPFGLLRSIGGPHPAQIAQTDKYVIFLFEQNTWFHTAKFASDFPKDMYKTWFGTSIARWEEDTLVIETRGFNGWTRIDTIGHPVSDELHTIERYRRPEMGRIEYSITIDDPKTYTQPWTSYRNWYLQPDWEILEYSCEENNKSLWEGRIKPPKLVQ